MKLKRKLCHLQVIIIDERSQLRSKVMGTSECHIQKFAYSGHNTNNHFAGIPVVLLIDDDYQFPPVIDKAAVSGYNKYKMNDKPIQKLTNALKINYL